MPGEQAWRPGCVVVHERKQRCRALVARCRPPGLSRPAQVEDQQCSTSKQYGSCRGSDLFSYSKMQKCAEMKTFWIQGW